MTTRPRHTYTGERVPAIVPICVAEGWRDAVTPALRHDGNLYRRPLRKRVGWRLGWLLARTIVGVA